MPLPHFSNPWDMPLKSEEIPTEIVTQIENEASDYVGFLQVQIGELTERQHRDGVKYFTRGAMETVRLYNRRGAKFVLKKSNHYPNMTRNTRCFVAGVNWIRNKITE